MFDWHGFVIGVAEHFLRLLQAPVVIVHSVKFLSRIYLVLGMLFLLLHQDQ
jgi:hypothetical protein